MTPYYADEQVTLYHGDALEALRSLPGSFVDCVVTSPPYYGLRDYGEPGQYGLEASPAEYVDRGRGDVMRRRWVGYSRPYLEWSSGRQYLGYWVRLADDVTRDRLWRVWRRRRVRGKR